MREQLSRGDFAYTREAVLLPLAQQPRRAGIVTSMLPLALTSVAHRCYAKLFILSCLAIRFPVILELPQRRCRGRAYLEVPVDGQLGKVCVGPRCTASGPPVRCTLRHETL